MEESRGFYIFSTVFLTILVLAQGAVAAFMVYQDKLGIWRNTLTVTKFKGDLSNEMLKESLNNFKNLVERTTVSV